MDFADGGNNARDGKKEDVLPAGIPQEISDEIMSIGHEAVTKANRIALTFAAAFSLLALIFFLRLPKGTMIEREESLAVRSPQ
jgi:hypothetical protein